MTMLRSTRKLRHGEARSARARLEPRALLAALFATLSIAAAADDPRDRLGDPKAEARARHLFTEVRCLVCQNESIDDSDADLAGDLRRVVRAQVAAGRSDAEIKRYLVARYGEFVLLRPTFSLGNAVLWLAPFVLVIGSGALLLARSRAGGGAPAPLTPEEEAELAALEDVDLVSPGSAPMPPHKKQSAVAEAEADTLGVHRPEP